MWAFDSLKYAWVVRVFSAHLPLQEAFMEACRCKGINRQESHEVFSSSRYTKCSLLYTAIHIVSQFSRRGASWQYL